jgi:hypothetical protein
MSQGSDQPQILGEWLSSLCALLPRPVILNGFYRDFLTRHFQTDLVEHKELHDLMWRDTERSNILIEMNTRWDPKQTGKVPAVIIKRNSYENVRLGIDDRNQGYPSDGKEHFLTLWSGSHTLFCIGGTGAQAEYLASEVQRELTEFGPTIRKWLNLIKFRVLTFGEPSELEEATENFVVPVTVGCVYPEEWVIDPNSPRLAKISLLSLIDS